MDGTMLIIALVLVSGAVVAVVVGAHHKSQIRLLSRPTTRICDAQAGRVKLLGQVDSAERFVSGVSEKKCIYMRIVIRDAALGMAGGLTSSHLSRRPTVRDPSTSLAMGVNQDVVHEECCHRLQLDDGSGQLDVDLTHSDIELLVDSHMKTNLLAPNDPEVEKTLRRFGIKTGPGSTGSYRLTETILEPGDQVLISGELQVTGDGKTVVKGTPEDPVFVTDKDAKTMTAKHRAGVRWSMVAAVGLGLLAAWMLVLSFAGSGGSVTPRDHSGISAFER